MDRVLNCRIDGASFHIKVEEINFPIKTYSSVMLDEEDEDSEYEWDEGENSSIEKAVAGLSGAIVNFDEEGSITVN